MTKDWIGRAAAVMAVAMALAIPGIAACGPIADAAQTTTPRDRAEPWRTYVNARYRYRICYPTALLRPAPEADNGDGRRFVASDRARLLVFGRNNIDGASLARTIDQDASDLAGSRGKVSYRVVRPGWAVFSGDDGGAMLFYSKTIRRGDQFVIFELSYPKSAAGRYKPVVEKLSRCFTALP